MPKSLNEMMHDDLNTELSRYFINNESIQQVIDCVSETKQAESSIYSTIASFESAGIVETSDVPLGSEKEKMNYLLVQAIDKATTNLSDNLNIASNIIKMWGDGLVFDNQGQKLENALAALNKPVKTQPIPAYSKMSDGQRTRTQTIFNKHAQQEEPLSIDYISDAIDKYNEGASVSVLSKALEMSVAYKNSVVMYDESTYLSLSDSKVTAHIVERFRSFRTAIDAIHSSGNKIGINSFLNILSDANKDKNNTVHNDIKSATIDLNFTEPTDEYNNRSKDSSSYNEIAGFSSEVNHLKPLDNNTINRLNAMCAMVNTLKDIKVLNISVKETTMSTDQAYDAISAYFNFIEEFTQNLIVFMFITQIAVRNHTVINEVIDITTRLSNVINGLFQEINDNISETGEVSQESITTSINYIKPKDAPDMTDNDVARQVHVYGRLSDSFNEKLNQLERIKLRGVGLVKGNTATKFINNEAGFIKESIGVDITEMDIEDIFNLMTSEYQSKNNELLNKSAVALDVVIGTDELSKRLRNSLMDDSFVTKTLIEPFATTTTVTYASATSDLEYHLNNLEEDLNAGDASAADKSLKRFIFNIGESSYFTSVAKVNSQSSLADQTAAFTLTTVPRVPYIASNNESYAIGYGELDRSAQELIFAAYNPSGLPVSLNTVKYNSDINELALAVGRWYKVKQINDNHKPVCKRMENVLGRLNLLNSKLSKHKLSTPETEHLVNALVADIQGAISDCTMRSRLIELTYETSNNINKTLCDIYSRNITLIDDFIESVK